MSVKIRTLFLSDIELDKIEEILQGKDNWDDLQGCLNALGIDIDPYRATELLENDSFGMCDICDSWTAIDTDSVCTNCWINGDYDLPY